MQLLKQLHEQNQQIEQMAEAIINDCKPYLQHGTYASKPLYRGMGKASELFLTKAVRRTDRHPLATDKTIHDLYNEYFQRKFGYPYRNGVFATSHHAQAKNYGTVYHIFPIGQFQVCWSPIVEDLYTNDFELLDYVDAKIDEFSLEDLEYFFQEMPYSELPDIVKETALNYVDKLQYQEGNLQQALQYDSEIMIQTKQYYAVKHVDAAKQVLDLISSRE